MHSWQVDLFNSAQHIIVTKAYISIAVSHRKIAV